MTTISVSSYSHSGNRYVVERSKSITDFTDQIRQETVQQDTGQPENLTSIRAELKALQRQQMGMSNHDYLLASLTLKEQISTERLNAGENHDVIGVRFEGQTFNLAGKLYGPGSLDFAKVSDSGDAQIVRPEDKLRIHLPRRQTGVDVQA